MSVWQPGDLAMVSADGRGGQHRLARRGTTIVTNRPCWWFLDTRTFTEVADVHAVALVDVEDREQVERLIDAINTYAHTDCESGSCRIDQTQAALRDYANPTPKPDEPTGLGAVVEGAKGQRWIRVEPDGGRAKWMLSDAPSNADPRYVWSAVNAVKVLSEGVPQ